MSRNPTDRPYRTRPTGRGARTWPVAYAAKVARAVPAVGTLTVLLGVVGAVLGAALAAVLPPIPSASAYGFVTLNHREGSDDPFGGSQFVLQRMQSYVELGMSPQLLDQVARDLERPDRAALSNQIEVVASPNTVVLQVDATDATPEGAARIANAVATRLGEAISALEGAGAPPGSSPVSLVVVQPALALPSPVWAHRVTFVLVGAFCGLALGVVAFLARPSRRRSRAGRAAVEEPAVEEPTERDGVADHGVADHGEARNGRPSVVQR